MLYKHYEDQVRSMLSELVQYVNNQLVGIGVLDMWTASSVRSISWFRKCPERGIDIAISRTEARRRLNKLGYGWLADHGSLKYRGPIRPNYNGKRLGRFTVIRCCDVTPVGFAETRWEVECDCGHQMLVTEKHLVGGNRFCNHCAAHPSGQVSLAARDAHMAAQPGIRHLQWESIKGRAAVRNKAFEITKEYAWSIYVQQNGRCALTGKEISMWRGGIRGTASLDRKDSAVGYVEGNVQWLHKEINMLKGKRPDAELIRMATEIADYHRREGGGPK